LRGIYILKRFRVSRLPEDCIQRVDGIGHFGSVSVKSVGERLQAMAAIERREGLWSLVGANRDQAVGFDGQFHSFAGQGLQKSAIDGGHITSNDQVPFGSGVQQRGFHSGEGSESTPNVGNDRETQGKVLSRIANDSDVACDLLNGESGALRESGAVEKQESFVGAHPCAVPAGQHVTGYAHSRMITLEFAAMIRFGKCLGLMAAFYGALLTAEEIPTRTTLVVRTDSKSGRLVRSVAVAPKVITAKATNEPETAAEEPARAVNSSLLETIDSIAAKYEVEAPLVHSVIKAESNYNTFAVSPKGAEGLMQLIPSTARRFGVANSFNPQQNIEGGVKYLKFLMELYQNDYVKVIAAYNAGEGAVTKYGGIPPYAETRNYVYQVGKNLVNARKAAEANKPAPVPVETKPSPNGEQFRTIQTLTGPDGKLYYKTQ